jgi:hypothetical protein
MSAMPPVRVAGVEIGPEEGVLLASSAPFGTIGGDEVRVAARRCA